MSTHPPAFILVRPQMGENIGAAARGMLNFGLNDLRLVAPRDGWPNQAAIDNSSGALETMPPAQVFDDIPASITNTHYIYGTTARRRDMTKPVMDIRAAVADAHARSKNGQQTAFMFGPERTGMENDDLAHCHAVVYVPTNDGFSSLNLGQCVLLSAYEWMAARTKISDTTIEMGDSFPADNKAFKIFVERLESELESSGFFKEDNLRPTMIRNIKNMFLRSELSDQELRTLHGIVSALKGKKKATD